MMLNVLFMCLAMNVSEPSFTMLQASNTPDEAGFAELLNDVNTVGHTHCEQKKNWLMSGEFEGVEQFTGWFQVLSNLHAFIVSNKVNRT